MKHKIMQIVPDRYLDNDNILGLVDSFHGLYATPIQRTAFNIKSENCITIKDKNRIWWEILITKDNISFYLVTPQEWSKFMRGQIETCWPKSEIRDIKDNLLFKDELCLGANITLAQHYFLSLKTDKRIVAPIPQLCEIAKTMDETDKALVQIGFEPAENDWYEGCEDALFKFKQGDFPRKFEVTPQRVIKGTAKILAMIGLEMMSTATEFITSQEVEPMVVGDTDRGQLLRQGGLSASTLQKWKSDACDFIIRLISESKDKRKRELQLRSMSAALRSLNEDNELIMKLVRDKDMQKFMEQVRKRYYPPVKLNRDYLSDMEVAKFIQLPSWNLQQEYPIENLESREIAVPEFMTKDGLMIGSVKHRGTTSKVYMPTNNHDELCLLEIVIGGLGSGKSLGKGAGKAVDAIRKGFSTFIIDVADGDMANTVRDGLPVWFPDNHIIDLDFGNRQYAFPLNWNESARQLDNLDFADELANQLTSYLEKFADEIGDRTNRYVKAAGKVAFANPDNTLLEVILMLCSKEYRRQTVKGITDARLLDLWRDFDIMSEGMKQMIVSPILNRIDRLTGSRYLANCIFQKPKTGKEKLDFRKFADGDRHPYCVILRCPKSILKKNCNPLVTFLIAKIWLSVLTRIDLVTSARKPCFLIMDEPHQFLGSAKGGIESTWGEMIAESRKWRLGQTFMFHDMGQIPNELMKLMKSAMPHYSIYSSSKETYKALQEEISPFTIEEAMEMPTHHAINIIRSHGEYHKFRAQMATPPIDVKGIPFKSWRYEYIDRSHRTKECLEEYGRLREEVEEDIYRRERVLYAETTKSTKGKR